jgi:hypothetical protein
MPSTPAKSLKDRIKNLPPIERLFHNKLIETRETTVGYDEIKFYPENARTILHFDILVEDKKKDLDEITIEERTCPNNS